MPELKEVFEMATKHAEPDVEAWRELEQRQRRVARNRKVGALAVAAVVGLAAVVVAIRATPDGSNGRTPLVPPERATGQLAFVDVEGTILGTIGADADDDGQVLLKYPEWGIALSPDGSRVVASNGFDIYTMNVDGTDLAKLTEGVTPSWSPDGSTIAFADEEGIHLISPDGTGRRTLVASRGAETVWPAWSPDGQRITYQITLGNPRNGIYIVDATGGRSTRITKGPDAFPAWHPDGTTIVFTRVGDTQDLFTVATDGRADPTPLVATARGESVGRWSPSGDLFAYWAFDTVSGVDLHVLDTRTGEDRVVLEDARATGWASDRILVVVI